MPSQIMTKLIAKLVVGCELVEILQKLPNSTLHYSRLKSNCPFFLRECTKFDGSVTNNSHTLRSKLNKKLRFDRCNKIHTPINIMISF